MASTRTPIHIHVFPPPFSMRSSHFRGDTYTLKAHVTRHRHGSPIHTCIYIISRLFSTRIFDTHTLKAHVTPHRHGSPIYFSCLTFLPPSPPSLSHTHDTRTHTHTHSDLPFISFFLGWWKPNRLEPKRLFRTVARLLLSHMYIYSRHLSLCAALKFVAIHIHTKLTSHGIDTEKYPIPEDGWFEELSIQLQAYHVCMRHVTHMNESCHTYGWVVLQTWMSHVTHTCVCVCVCVYMWAVWRCFIVRER